MRMDAAKGLLPVLVICHSLSIPTPAPLCSSFGFNWAAEIRCLRALLSQCAPLSTLSREVRETVLDASLLRREGDKLSTTRLASLPSTTSSSSSTPTLSALSSVTTPATAAHFPQATPRPNMEMDGSTPSLFNCSTASEVVQSLRLNLTREMNWKLNELSRQMEERIGQIRRKGEIEVKKIQKELRLLTQRVSHFNSSQYIIVDEEESWYAAEEKCRLWGGHLASIHSTQENIFLIGLAKGRALWIGMNDVQKEEQFVYTDHSLINFSVWHEGQPDNAAHNENCVEMRVDGKWSDSLCLLTRHFVCKR